MSGHKPRIPDSTRNAILDQVRTTPRHYTDIAEEFGVSKYFVSKVAREHGFKRKRSRPRKPMDRATEAAIASEFDRDELTAEEIGEKYGRSKNTVLRIARRMRPDIDIAKRGHRLAMKKRGRSTNPYEISKTERKRAARRKLEDCPREQKIRESMESLTGENNQWRLRPARTWEEVAEEMRRRAAEDERLRGSFEAKSIRNVAYKAMEKLRTALEEYEFPEDTPNRNAEYLRANIV